MLTTRWLTLICLAAVSLTACSGTDPYARPDPPVRIDPADAATWRILDAAASAAVGGRAVFAVGKAPASQADQARRERAQREATGHLAAICDAYLQHLVEIYNGQQLAAGGRTIDAFERQSKDFLKTGPELQRATLAAEEAGYSGTYRVLLRLSFEDYAQELAGRTYLDAAFVEWLRAEGTQAARFDSFLPQPAAVR